LSGIFSGGLREPEAVGVGVGLDGDFIAARALVAKNAGEPISIIPFLPNVVSGPAIVPDSFSIAPADSEVFATGSLDWARIYDTLVANLDKPQPSALTLGDGDAEEPERGSGSGEDKVQPASSQQTIEAMEKLFGFRVREDLLPALGNEVSVSLPLDFFEGRRSGMVEKFTVEELNGGEKPAQPGPVVLIALNNPEALRKVMPLALAAFGLGGGQAQTERRKGFDIQNIGGMAYVFINNHLVVGENAPAVRHVVDAYTSNQTLAMSAKFRDSIAWQEHQRLALAYVSDGLMKTWVESAKKTASGSADPVVLAALAQLDAPPSSVSYAVTNESDALLHSLRLPIPLIKVFAASSIIAVKEAPVTGNESMATYAMMRVASAEEAYKTGKGRNRYGSLEELYAEKVLEKEYTLPEEYEFKLEVVGDKFTLSATPKNYGKTGRRSFFVDETGTVRAADHKGEAATADDPPLDQ
jgi:hypothetical protein